VTASTSPGTGTPGASAVVPGGLVGQPVGRAEVRLRAAGFIVIRRVGVPASAPVGTVTKVNPPSGARVDTSRTITLRVSLGAGRATVPDVLNQTEAEARRRVSAAGLSATTSIDTGPTSVGPGLVEAVAPGVGASVAPGSAVTLTVVSRRVAVPDVVALACNTAADELRRFGLTADAMGTQQLNGKVASQNPQAGAVADRGTAVRIVCLLR
jgi:beta-lactam-binding protein with PASTA domain